MLGLKLNHVSKRAPGEKEASWRPGYDQFAAHDWDRWACWPIEFLSYWYIFDKILVQYTVDILWLAIGIDHDTIMTMSVMLNRPCWQHHCDDEASIDTVSE